MSKNHRLDQALKAGVKIPKDGYWGDVPSRICGAYAGMVDANTFNVTSHSFENKLRQADKN
jgi:hypothetical protein